MSDTLTHFIAQDLRERLREGRPLPAPLSLSGLAAHYRVSLTPVRRATQMLLIEGLLQQTETGRLKVAILSQDKNHRKDNKDNSEDRTGSSETEGSQFDSQETAHSSGSSAGALRADSDPDWETRLVQEIVIRSLRGEDAYLREEASSWRYGIGRAALRAAFVRLAGRGLLIHVPRCGWRVRAFDENDLRAYLVMREVLETTALDLALPHLDTEQLLAMQEGNAVANECMPARLNNDLHRYLVEKSGNAYIQEFFDRHGVYYAALFDFAAPEADQVNEMALQHRTILDALIRRDRTAAHEALVLHIRSQYPVVKRLLAALNTAPIKQVEPV